MGTAFGRILVADDENSIRMGCEKILTAEGYQIVTVADGRAAVTAYTQNPFDVILLDLRMPQLDGLGVIQEVKKFDPDAVIVMITGYASFETAVKAVQSGAYDYVPKPFTPSELRITVSRAMERRRLIRERERTLQDLAQERSRTRVIIDAMAEPMLVVNDQQELVMWNPAASRFLLSEHRLQGQPLASCLAWQSMAQTFAKLISEAGAEASLATEIESPDRHQTWLMSVTPLGPSAQGGKGWVMVFSDVTPMKDLERAKSRFVSMVAHELKAPIGAIQGYLDLIRGDLNESQADFRQKIERCSVRAEQLLQLIRELLDLSRIEQGRIERRLESCNPWEAIREVCTFLEQEAAAKGVSLIFQESPSGSPMIRADRQELTQIFTNLVTNAIKYNRSGGKVTISEETSLHSWRCTVQDTGIGIDAKHLEHIGEEFFRVKSSQTVSISGTGLGMSIVRRLLALNHATLEIVSTVGTGSAFTLVWPIGQKEEETAG